MNLAKLSTPSRLMLGASVIFGFVYLLTDFGLTFDFPLSAAVKAMGIILLAGIALREKAPILAMALLASAVGDIMLAWQPRQMVFGIAAFGVVHLVYIGIFAGRVKSAGLRGLPGWIGAGLIAIFGAAMLTWLYPGMGELTVPATIYNGIILVMAVLAAISRAPFLALAGALLFVLSDSFIGAREFQNAFMWSGPVIWATYYIGQLFLTLGLLMRDPA